MRNNQKQIKKEQRFNRVLGSIFLLLFLLVSCNVSAKENVKPLNDAEKAARKIINPKFKIEKVVFDEKLNMYRVSVNGSYMHMTPDMRYAFVGDVLDIHEGKSILYSPKQTEFSSLPHADAIKKGNGKHKIALFMDMNCSYCHKQYKELSANKDVTLFVYLYPFMGKDSREKAEKIWLSKNRVKALDDVIINGLALKGSAEKGDTSALDRNVSLARSLNIRSTPTMIYSDGKSTVGYIPADRLRDILETKGKK